MIHKTKTNVPKNMDVLSQWRMERNVSGQHRPTSWCGHSGGPLVEEGSESEQNEFRGLLSMLYVLYKYDT